MNQNTMNYHNSSRSTLIQNRSARAASFQSQPARFTSETESEGIELFLRGLLVLSLIVALAICSQYLAAVHGQPASLPTHETAVADAQPAAAVPAAKAL